MKLVIAEKPSVGGSLSKVIGANQRKNGYYEGNGYIVTWCIGHLVRMSSPDKYDEKYAKWKIEDLPIFPEEYLYELNPKTKKQFTILKKLMEDKRVTSIVNACDAGREGELIFGLVYKKANCKKPIERLWISSMEDEAIRTGFNNLRDGNDFKNLYESAQTRAIADWLVGMNLSRLYSCLYSQNYSVGRVQTPTLYLIAKRDTEIELFKKEKYYTVDLFSNNLKLISERIDDFAVANQLKNLIDDEIKLKSVETKEKIIKPEKPYDLTSLQREANKYFGYSAKDTLTICQSLYEKKLITYPRTDSRFLTNDMVSKVKTLLEKLEENFAINEKNFNSIFDSSKVTDHYAIVPTLSGINKIIDLTERENRIYNLIKDKLLMACSDDLIESNTKITYEHEIFTFTANGKVVIDEGYFKYLKTYVKDKEDKFLPSLKTGDVISINDKQISEKFTKPPTHYTEESLLKVMEHVGTDILDKDIEVERKGLGTPATRAGVIENLIYKDLIKRDKKKLLITHKGNQLVSIVEEKFRSAETTSEWEMKLSKISTGELSKEEFLNEIKEDIRELTNRYKESIDKKS